MGAAHQPAREEKEHAATFELIHRHKSVPHGQKAGWRKDASLVCGKSGGTQQKEAAALLRVQGEKSSRLQTGGGNQKGASVNLPKTK